MSKVIKTFFDENRQRHVTYSLLTYFLGLQVASNIMNAFEDLTGHYNCRSRDQAWRSVKIFVSYLRAIEFDSEVPRTDLLIGFTSFLEGRHRLRKTNGSHYNFIRRLILWMAEVSENDIWIEQDLRYVNFVREQKCNRDNFISNEQLQKIANACKKAISDVRLKFKVREDLLNGLTVNSNIVSSKDILNIRSLIAFEEKSIWTQDQLYSAGASTLGASGLRRLSQYKELTLTACLPIFLLIMIQTAANPMALMEIKANCLTINPLDEHSANLEWLKGRASRVQRLALMRAGNYSVPSLIELIVKMTAPIRHLAPNSDKELLFIIRRGCVARRLSVQSLHDYLSSFREENTLDYFTFSDVRKAVAEIVYVYSESNEKVAKVLQHKNMNTSKFYLNGDRVKQLKYERLAGFQGQMLKLTEANSSNSDEEYQTVLGFNCSSPLDGYARDSRKGEPCMEFVQCASCKNAIVVADDAVAIARVIRARDHLIEMKLTSDLTHDASVRFNEVFNPILTIIERDILKKVPSKVLNAAKNILKDLPNLPVVY